MRAAAAAQALSVAIPCPKPTRDKLDIPKDHPSPSPPAGQGSSKPCAAWPGHSQSSQSSTEFISSFCGAGLQVRTRWHQGGKSPWTLLGPSPAPALSSRVVFVPLARVLPQFLPPGAAPAWGAANTNQGLAWCSPSPSTLPPGHKGGFVPSQAPTHQTGAGGVPPSAPRASPGKWEPSIILMCAPQRLSSVPLHLCTAGSAFH